MGERKAYLSIYAKGRTLGEIIQQLYCTHRWLGHLTSSVHFGTDDTGLNDDDKGMEDKGKKLGKRKERGRGSAAYFLGAGLACTICD